MIADLVSYPYIFIVSNYLVEVAYLKYVCGLIKFVLIMLLYNNSVSKCYKH